MRSCSTRAQTARDNRTKRPWAEPLKSKAQSTYIFDYYPKASATRDERESVVHVLNLLGNRQFDTVGRDDMAFSKYSFHDAEVMFDSMDKDNSGSIDLDEFRAMLQKLEVEITEAETELILEVLDADNSGSLELDEVKSLFRAAQYYAGRKLADSRPGCFTFPTDKIFDTDNPLSRLLSMMNPPMRVQRVFTALMLLVQPAHAIEEDCNWAACRRWIKELGGPTGFLDNLSRFDPCTVSAVTYKRTKAYMRKWGIKKSAVTGGLAGGVVVALCNWLEEMLEIAIIGRATDQPLFSESTGQKLHRKKRWKAPKQARRPRKLNDRPTYSGHQRPSTYTMQPALPKSRQQDRAEMDIFGVAA